MSELFYTNPVKAIWMQQEFGVRFLNNQEPDNLAMEAPLWEMTEEILGNGSTYAPWYVHPDSYAVFEPKEGDYYINTGERKNAGKLSRTKREGVLSYIKYHDKWPIQIIQRDNKAFFSPEVEPCA